MKVKWLNGFNEETQQNEQFYPITHKDAVIGLDNLDLDGDYVTSEPFDQSGDGEPGMPPIVANKFVEIENRISNIEDDLDGYIARLTKI